MNREGIIVKTKFKGGIILLKIKITVPSHVRHFCEGEFKSYPLYKKRIQDRRQEIINTGPGVAYHRISHQQKTSYSIEMKKIERILMDRQIQADEKSCQYVEDVLRGMSERQLEVINACYWENKSNLEAADKLNISERMIKRYKRDAIIKLAIRWGLI